MCVYLPHCLCTESTAKPGTVKVPPVAATVVKSEPVERSDKLLSAVTEFCREALGHSVLGLPELKDKLLMKQSALGVTHPLCVGGVSDGVLVEGVKGCGAVELIGGGGKHLYALTHGQKVSPVCVECDV